MKQLLLVLVVLFAAQWLEAQDPITPKWFARLDLYHQDYATDFSYGQLGIYDRVRIRPGFRIGVEGTWVEKKHFRLYQDLLIGYYHNTYEERSVNYGTDLGLEWRIFKQFRVAVPIGLYLHWVKAIDVRYVYDGEKWVKAENNDPQIRRLQIPIGLNLGWRFWPATAHPIEVFANANISAIGPYQPGFGIPVFFYKAAGIGLKLGL